MLNHEINKLFIKQYGLIAIAVIIIIQAFVYQSLYQNSDFSNENTKNIFYGYMEVMEGKLDAQKEKFISDEQETILDAQSRLKLLQNSLLSGRIKDMNEYADEFAKLQADVSKADAFEQLLSMYNYAMEDTDRRYIIMPCKIGFCRDYPDIVLTVIIILYSALFFLCEESSRVIALIRACGNSKVNVFLSKLTVLFIFIFSAHFSSAICEYFFLRLYLRDGINYPVQSLEYFEGCEYSFSVLQIFIFVQILKFLGYLFLSGITVLLSVTVKKAVPIVSIPLATCIIQQFIFTEPSYGYFLPTGLLRSVGYFRGNVYETRHDFSGETKIKVFSAVPESVLFIVITVAVIFIFAMIKIGVNYYIPPKRQRLKLLSLCLLPVIILMLGGCTSAKQNPLEIYFNLNDAGFISQNDKYYFYFDNLDGRKLTAVNKETSDRFNVLRTPFYEEIAADNCCLAGGYLYLFRFGSAKSFAIYRIDLNSYDLELVAEQNTESFYSFLGLKFDNNVVIDKTVLRFFTDTDSLFLITNDNELYKCGTDLRNAECIISDGIYNNNLVYAYNKIYYINNKLELKECSADGNQSRVLSSKPVKAFDIYGETIIYSGNDGVFALNVKDSAEEQLSDMSADRIDTDEGRTVFSADDAIYLLDEKSKECTEIYGGRLVSFNIITGTDYLLGSGYSEKNKRIEDFIINLEDSDVYK